jgi:hypothetical protein
LEKSVSADVAAWAGWIAALIPSAIATADTVASKLLARAIIGSSPIYVF